MPAVLLVALAAMASLLGAPAVAAADTLPAPRATVGAAPGTAGRPPLVARQHGAREARGAPAARRTSRDRSASAALLRPAERFGAAGPAPSPAALWVLLALALAVLGRLRAGPAGWSLLGGTTGQHPSRAPPAYARC